MTWWWTVTRLTSDYPSKCQFVMPILQERLPSAACPRDTIKVRQAAKTFLLQFSFHRYINFTLVRYDRRRVSNVVPRLGMYDWWMYKVMFGGPCTIRPFKIPLADCVMRSNAYHTYFIITGRCCTEPL